MGISRAHRGPDRPEIAPDSRALSARLQDPSRRYLALTQWNCSSGRACPGRAGAAGLPACM